MGQLQVPIKILIAVLLLLFGQVDSALENRVCCDHGTVPEECHYIEPSHTLYPIFCSEADDHCGIDNGICVSGISSDCNIECDDGHSHNCHFDNCVGAIGRDCEGVEVKIPLGPLGTFSLDLSPVEHLTDAQGNPNDMVRVRTGIGSILHDLCCREHPHGAFCDPSNYPLDQTVNIFGSLGHLNDCACLLEWRRATWDDLYGMAWKQEFPSAPHSSDLTPRPDVVRRSWLPQGVLAGGFVPFKSHWNVTEVEATANLCAPKGTTLFCPPEDRDCDFYCIGFYCSTCSPEREDCTQYEKSLWNAFSRNHVHAGDSDYCCSGKFDRIVWTLLGTRYGECA